MTTVNRWTCNRFNQVLNKYMRGEIIQHTTHPRLSLKGKFNGSEIFFPISNKQDGRVARGHGAVLPLSNERDGKFIGEF